EQFPRFQPLQGPPVGRCWRPYLPSDFRIAGNRLWSCLRPDTGCAFKHVAAELYVQHHAANGRIQLNKCDIRKNGITFVSMISMKKLVGILVLSVVASSAAMAQRFAYVDTEYILKHIPEYLAAQKQLDALSVQWQEEVD